MLADLERFANDALEKIFERGMGVIYSNGHALNKIRRALTDDERAELIGLYLEHHNLQYIKWLVSIMAGCCH